MSPLASPERRDWKDPWHSPSWMPPCLISENTFLFLGEIGNLYNAEDWNQSEKNKLWIYNLHYLDDLNAKEASQRIGAHCKLVDRWINENPPLAGNGWEPYTLSLRIVNLVKWFSSGPFRRSISVRDGCIPEIWVESLMRQAQALSAQREYHLLANHLFANGKALIFAGAFLGGDEGNRWLKQGLDILDGEVPEQFLADGGNFELSPMYHATLLWDLCDLLRLSECTCLMELEKREMQWKTVLSKGMDWLSMMVHPDGGLSFFNDACFEIAPSLSDIQCYAASFGLPHATWLNSSLRLKELMASFDIGSAEHSGYVAIEWDPACKAILDIAPVGPDYQPGHAHADTLSFELSLFARRILVNSGISQYGEDFERHRQRSTAAHNTVVVNGENSSEVWSGFRVARRARPLELFVSTCTDALFVRGSHDGYQRLTGNIVHCREWFFNTGKLVVHDVIEGEFSNAEARFHFHPDVQLDLSTPCQGGFSVGDRYVGIMVNDGQARIETSTWHPRFSASHPNQCLVVTLNGSSCETTFFWS